MVSEEQWEKIKEILEIGLDRVSFMYHEQMVSVYPMFIQGYLKFLVYINGSINSEWRDPHHLMYPIVQKLWRRSERYAYSRRTRRLINAYANTPYQDEKDKKNVLYHPDFNNAHALLCQFKKLSGLTLLYIPPRGA